jgi:DNA repair exonuclease SbcCD ATPase subunit
MTNKSYNDIEAYKAECMERLNELNASIEGISRHADERIKSFEDFISESKNSIDEFFGKTDLIDKAIAVKKDVEQKIDDLNADMDKLALRGAELAELKVQFERANRMEEELNNKMTRFDIEQQRIERMESNFNRLLKTSQSVEERIKYITDSDDKLQEAQIKIRKLGDAMTEAEEKYQRIEKKNKILEETNDGIDNNLKALQESEAAVQKIIGDTRHLEADIKDMRTLIETLAGENIKAKDTFQKLETLDKDIAYIDSRIQSIQKARVWVADLETRIDEKSREMQRQSKLTDDTAKKQSGGVADTEDAYSPRIRDNVITLKRKGWGIDEIGNSLNISRAAVELILETWHGDK